MSNTILTPSMITKDALIVIENNLTFTRQVNRDYSDEFAVAGAKIGNTVNVRRPARYVGTTGPALNVEAHNETSMPVTLTTQFHVDVQFSSQDLTLSLDDFTERVSGPAVATIANKIDRDGIVMGYQNTANAVGTAGTIPSALTVFTEAGAYLDSEGAPRDGKRAMVIDPWCQASMADYLKGLYNPQEKISDVYESGEILGKHIGFSWFMDQNVASHTVGPLGGTPLVNGASQGITSGWASTTDLVTDGWTAAAASRLKKGDTFTIAGVYGVNPQNRQSYGKLRKFVVTADVSSDSSGNATITISPAIISGGQFQNVSAAPADNAALTITGAANTVTPQHLAFHRNAFTIASADLEMPQGVHFAARVASKKLGLSLRCVRQYTINNDALPARFDVLYGWSPLYTEHACRVYG
ncbi:MAG: P22 phage major capsid protein family protein [Candidatus Bathyarchaeota archaeon]